MFDVEGTEKLHYNELVDGKFPVTDETDDAEEMEADTAFRKNFTAGTGVTG